MVYTGGLQGFWCHCWGVKQYNWKWGLAACCSKTDKEARLVERKVCFILGAGNWEEGWHLSKGWLNPPALRISGLEFLEAEGATCRNSTVSSDSYFEIGHWWSDQHQIQLVFSSRVVLFPFPWGQFWELWQLMSRLQSGHHRVNFFHLVGRSVYIGQLIGNGSEYYL